MEQIENADKYLDMIIQMGIDYLPDVLLAVVTLLLGLWLIGRLMVSLEKAFDRSGMEATLKRFIRNLVSVGLKILLVISVASMVGVATTSFIAVVGAAGLAIGLALQGSLSNFAGGVIILLFRPYKVGDYIETSGHSGTVKEIAIFHTILTTPDNKTIILPNGAVSNGSIINYSTEPQRRVDMVFGISYDDDLRAAKEVIKGFIDSEERILEDPEPMIVISSLGDNSVNLTTRCWVESANYWPVFFHMTESVKLALDEAGITIPYPQRDVHVYQESVD